MSGRWLNLKISIRIILDAELDEVVLWSMQAFSGKDPKAYKEKLIDKIDHNKDGKLELNEFMQLFG